MTEMTQITFFPKVPLRACFLKVWGNTSFRSFRSFLQKKEVQDDNL